MIVNPGVPRVVVDEGNSEELWELATCNLFSQEFPMGLRRTKKDENTGNS